MHGKTKKGVRGSWGTRIHIPEVLRRTSYHCSTELTVKSTIIRLDGGSRVIPMVSPYQGFKLRNISMHTLGAQIDKSLYQTIFFSCVHFYVKVFLIWKMHLHMPDHRFLICASRSKYRHKEGGYSLNCKHRIYVYMLSYIQPD